MKRNARTILAACLVAVALAGSNVAAAPAPVEQCARYLADGAEGPNMGRQRALQIARKWCAKMDKADRVFFLGLAKAGG